MFSLLIWNPFRRLLWNDQGLHERIWSNRRISRVLSQVSQFYYLQDRRNRKSRTTSMEIESMNETSGSAEVQTRLEQSESHTSEIMDRNWQDTWLLGWIIASHPCDFRAFSDISILFTFSKFVSGKIPPWQSDLKKGWPKSETAMGNMLLYRSSADQRAIFRNIMIIILFCDFVSFMLVLTGWWGYFPADFTFSFYFLLYR